MEIEEVIENLSELENESTVPKNIRSKIRVMINELKSDKDMSLKVNKSLSELDDISEDINIPMFVRTKIWEITSMLEKIEN